MTTLRKVNNQSDFALMQEAINGSQKAFRILCANNTLLITTIVKRMTRGGKVEQCQDDLIQMVYIKMWQKMSTLEDQNIKGWISNITQNLVIDEIRKANKTNLISISNTNNRVNEEETVELEFFIKDEELNPEELMEKEEADRVFNSIITCDELSDIQKKILNLRYIEGMKYEKIAKKLDMNLQTVKAVIFRAKKALQNKLKAS